jgi:type III pantothenate kinase
MAETRQRADRARRAAPDLRPDFRLAVDVGNTQTVLGLFDGDRILKRWRLATRKDVTVDEIALSLRGLVIPMLGARKGGRGAARAAPPPAPIRCAIASVVPAQDGPWRGALSDVFGIAPRVLDHRDCGGLRLDYEIPSQIGADRLANVLGARALGIPEGIVVDFGTATTFDIFTRGAYHGGVICPGLQSGMRALAQNAARLAEAELRWPETSVGRTTDEALRIGVLRGAVGMVEHLLGEIVAERGMRRPVILATGGLSHRMKGHAPSIRRFEPDLTLVGINHLLASPAPGANKSGKKPARSRRHEAERLNQTTTAKTTRKPRP